MKKINYCVFGLMLVLMFAACQNATETKATDDSKTATAGTDSVKMKPPSWAKNAIIYELNTRQFSKEGNFAKATEALPRIKDLGVDIIWLMPIYPICDSNRKCDTKSTTQCLGSPYAAYDFKAINPSLGNAEDLKKFVSKAHELGLKVILDFVPDHTGWGSKWMKEHPEYFVKVNGKITTPLDPITRVPTDWSDVAMLDYGNKDLRTAVIDAHQYWIKEFDVDGFREDVAGFVPNDFWAELRPKLDSLKPVFMLAEWGEDPVELTTCFQMNYGWRFFDLITGLYKGKQNADSLAGYIANFKPRMPKEGYQMLFTQNHDKNAWEGTEHEFFGDAGNTFTALCFTFDGMGLIYDGQESSLNKRLSLFNKDEINWEGKSRADFFKKLTTLKHNNKALWNGLDGGEIKRIETNDSKNIFAFAREKDGDSIFCIYNLSPKPADLTLKGTGYTGNFKNVMKNGEVFELKADMKMKLNGWDYLILSNK